MGVIFAYGGWSKLTEPVANFEATLWKYGVFPPSWIPALARIVPWLEWLLGCFLIVGYATRLAALGTGLLSLGFLITLGASPIFVEAGNTDCGCFGSAGLRLSVRQIFIVDLMALVITARLVWLKRFAGSLDGWLLKPKPRLDDTKSSQRK